MGRRLVSAGRRTEKSWGASARTQARAHAGARARATAAGIHQRTRGSGVAVTASETALFFTKSFKRSMTIPCLPKGFQFVHQFAQAPQNPIAACRVTGSQFAQHFSNLVLYSIRSRMGQMVSPLKYPRFVSQCYRAGHRPR